MTRRLLWAAIILAGCRGGDRAAATPGAAVPLAVGAPAPGNFSDLAPGDTAAVVAMMRQVMRSIDAGVGTMTSHDTTIGGPDALLHHLTLWTEGGVPRKLVVVDSAAGGGANVETDTWFMGGDVAVVLQPRDAYAFDAGRIVLWTDDTFAPRTDVTADDVMARESALIDQVRGWLAPFKIALP